MRMATLLLASVGLAAPGASAQEVVGAGSTAAAKLIEQWGRQFSQAGPAIRYEGGGSGAGLRRLRAGEAVFAVSDIALSVPELQAGGLVQFPVALGGIVPVANLDGEPLRLAGDVLARIFLGQVKSWRAPEIAALNPGRTLPDLPVVPVARSEASGSTAVFTGYLSRVSPAWKAAGGAGLVVKWPDDTRTVVGSDAMADFVERTPGAIGYVDYSRVRGRKLHAPLLVNRAGRAVAAAPSSIQSAAAAFPWAQAPAFSVLLLDQAGEESWPITAPVFVVMALAPKDPEPMRRALAFFEWAMSDGEAAAERLGFVALPDAVALAVRHAWSRQFKDASGKPLYTLR
ncbi:MAG: phosphate ABC transporter substrate-binding protein PstS [Vicinamibacteria bacterium]|nr:phosphate ABC transporter substrate-binding protein PstS [Vicinamibacteria bacterium]